MKYLRVVIFFLTILLIGISVYYVYTKLRPARTQPVLATEDAPRVVVINKNTSNKVVSQFSEYTTQDSKKSGKLISIEGVFQAADAKKNTINGVTYDYVIGILGKDGALSSVWLTSSEYAQISEIVKNFGRSGEHVTLTLSDSTINFITPNGSTNN